MWEQAVIILSNKSTTEILNILLFFFLLYNYLYREMHIEWVSRQQNEVYAGEKSKC